MAAKNNGLRHKRKRYRPRGRHYRDGARAAAVRAFTGASLYLGGGFSLGTASMMVGSNPHYVEAAATILQCEDDGLIDGVLVGDLPLLATAKTVRTRAKLITSYQNATMNDLIALGRVAGPGTVFDKVVVPAL